MDSRARPVLVVEHPEDFPENQRVKAEVDRRSRPEAVSPGPDHVVSRIPPDLCLMFTFGALGEDFAHRSQSVQRGGEPCVHGHLGDDFDQLCLGAADV